jgi:tRNA threonylcarbamoyladenosine modification (KEOPS) complex  Pcc1 subunit
LQLPPDLDLGKIGRAVLLELATDEREDSRVRVVAARELLVLGVAAEERERLRAIEQSSAITQMTDAELEALVRKPE